jgi:hypothetical protein
MLLLGRIAVARREQLESAYEVAFYATDEELSHCDSNAITTAPQG